MCVRLRAVRKVGFVALPVFFDEDSIYGIMFVLAMCFVTFGALMSVAPYTEDTDDYVAQLCQARPQLCSVRAVCITSSREVAMRFSAAHRVWWLHPIFV